MKLVSRLTSILGVIGLFFSVSVKAESDVRISIDQGVSMAQPIAVIPFKAMGGVPDDVAQIIADDLRNSGKFTPLDRASLPAQPSSAVEVNPEQWTNIGIDNVVVGQVSVVGGGYNIAYQLVDTLGTSGAAGNVIVQGSFNVPAAQMRLGAHTVSDQVFEKLTQIRGAFRTKIAYVVQRGVSSYELRVSDYDGFNAFTIVKSKEPLMSPEWSPDGSKLAYVTFE
ncbi:Tol-Pal system protein TolB, partial [Glaesserella parasuis]|nr:Tol-Pal system protein TolB [Glaesserella parasuis]